MGGMVGFGKHFTARELGSPVSDLDCRDDHQASLKTRGGPPSRSPHFLDKLCWADVTAASRLGWGTLPWRRHIRSRCWWSANCFLPWPPRLPLPGV